MTARRVLRLARTPVTRDNRKKELTRIFAGAVEVLTVDHDELPARVAELARTGEVAVVADVYRQDLDELRRAVAPLPVLRPVLERRPGRRAGPPASQFMRYAQLGLAGELIELADGVLG